MADSPHSDNAASFDAYYELLGIPPAEQPPTHYRLLGLSPLESNPKIIERAADRQMSHLRTFKAGQQAVASQKLLSEVAKASRVLLTPEEKAVYDATLTQLTAAKPVAPLRPIAAKPLAPAIAPAKPIPLQTTIPLPVDVVDPAAFSQLDAGSPRSRKSNSSNLPLVVSGVASFALVVLIAVVFVLMNRGNRPADIVEVDRANVSPTDPTDQPGETPPSPPPVAPEVPAVAPAPVPPNPPASAAVTPPGVEPIAETGNSAADTQSLNAVVSTPPKPANELPPGRWVDLLALVRLPDDAVSGNWTLRDGRASIDGKSGGKLKLPVDLTGASYDLQVEFESDSDPGNVNVMLPVGDRSVLVVGDGYQNVGTWSYFSLVGNKEPPQVPGSVQGPVLEAGKRYTYDISVRLNGDQARLAVSLNNKPLYHYDGPIAALRIVPAYKLENEGWPGLASWFSPIDYVGCKVRLESGRATFTRNATTSWTEGAVLAFTFDNNTISRRDGQLVVRDLSGHNNHGVIAGGTTPTEGKSGEALRFARRDDFVECADAESLKPVNEFTLAAWFLADNWHGAVHDGSIISKEDWKRGTSNGYVLRGGKRAVDMTIGLHGWKTCVSEPSLATGQWHHAVGTFDGKELRLYVNGQAQTPRPAEGTIAVSNYPLKIGASAFAKERHFMGAIDEVAIWNRALTADEAVSLYEFSKNGKSYCAGIGRAAR